MKPQIENVIQHTSWDP